MAFNSIPASWIAVGKVLKQSLFQYIKDNDDYLYSAIGGLSSGDVPNGSFEIDSDGDGIPDNWTRNLYPGGSSAREQLTSLHAGYGFKFVHPGGAGNGGGYLTSDYVPCSEYLLLGVQWIHYASAAGMHNRVTINWYTNAKTYLSNTVVYNSTANPTSPTPMLAVVPPPAGARHFKIILDGGMSDNTTGGTAYFDGVRVTQGGYSGRLGVPTLAQQSTASESWADAGSLLLPLYVPANAYISYLSFTADLYTGAAVAGYQRFRIGTLYSNENSQVSATWNSYRYSMSGLTTSPGQLTLVQQLYTGWSGAPCYGRINTPDARIVVV